MAVSLAKNSVGSPQIKNGQVKAADLASNGVTSAKIKNGQVTGADVKESTLATVPSATRANNVLSAAVTFDGTLVPSRSHHAVSATLVGSGVRVTFDRDVTGCSYVASPGFPGAASPGPGEVGVASSSEPDTVYVETFDSTGAVDDLPFTVIVAC